jgi:hypothetical protein
MLAPKDPKQDIGLRQGDICRLLATSKRNLFRLRHHPDPAMRYPAADFIVMGRPIWRLSTHERYIRQRKPRLAELKPQAQHAAPPVRPLGKRPAKQAKQAEAAE